MELDTHGTFRATQQILPCIIKVPKGLQVEEPMNTRHWYHDRIVDNNRYG